MEVHTERLYDDGGEVVRARLTLELRDGGSRVFYPLDFAEEAARLTHQILLTRRSFVNGFGPYQGAANQTGGFSCQK